MCGEGPVGVAEHLPIGLPHSRKQPGDGWQEVHGLEQPFVPASDSTSLRKYCNSLIFASDSICLPAELGTIHPLASNCPDTTDTRTGGKRKTPSMTCKTQPKKATVTAPQPAARHLVCKNPSQKEIRGWKAPTCARVHGGCLRPSHELQRGRRG